MAYKSEFYDPKKAHEYYEKHKKLKGKRSKLSTAGMSKKQKRVASYVKSEIANRRKADTKAHAESTKQKREALRNEVNLKVSDLRKRLNKINNSSLSNNQKAEARGALREELNKIKDNYKAKVDELNSTSKKEAKKIKKNYSKKYKEEFKKIKKDKSLKKRR